MPSPYLLEALLYVLLLFLIQQLHAVRARSCRARRPGTRPGGTLIPSRSSWPMRPESSAI